MGGGPGKLLTSRVEADLRWSFLDKKRQEDLIRLAEGGKQVSLIDDVPEIPSDVTEIYEAFSYLRNSTPSDIPIPYEAKLAAWEIHGREDLGTFLRLISAMDIKFLELMAEKRKIGEKKRSLKPGQRQVGPSLRRPRAGR